MAESATETGTAVAPEREGRTSRRDVPTRLPPHSGEAEAGVLGCCLLSPEECIARCVEGFRGLEEPFYDLRHQTIYGAMVDLHGRHVPVDAIVLQQWLKDRGLLEDCGGIGYLAELPDKTPSASNLAYYLDIVREKYVLRRVIATATESVAKAYEFTGRADELLASIGGGFEELSGLLMHRRELTIQEVLRDKVIPRLEEHYTRGKQQLSGLSTGLAYLDKIVQGIQENYYFVVAARPGDGKTSWAMNLTERLSGQGLPVGVFTLEMTDESLAKRLLFSVSDVELGQFSQGFATEQDWQRLVVGASKLAQQKIYLDAEADQTMDVIAAKARRWVREYGIKLFVLDYLQLLDDDSEKYRNDRVQALRRISKKIVSLKNTLKVPWLVLAQMNRNIETADVRRPPVLSDLKECGAIEQDADVVGFLYKPLKAEEAEEDAEKIRAAMDAKGNKDKTTWPRRVNMAVVKHRYGPTGKAKMLFLKNRCRFLDWREWELANQVVDYGKGERRSANTLEGRTDEPRGEQMPPPPEEDLL